MSNPTNIIPLVWSASAFNSADLANVWTASDEIYSARVELNDEGVYVVAYLDCAGSAHPTITNSRHETLDAAQAAVQAEVTENEERRHGLGFTADDLHNGITTSELAQAELNELINNAEAGQYDPQVRNDLARTRGEEVKTFLTECRWPFITEVMATDDTSNSDAIVWAHCSDEDATDSKMFQTLMDLARQLDLNLNNYSFVNGTAQELADMKSNAAQMLAMQQVIMGKPPISLDAQVIYTPTPEVVAEYTAMMEQVRAEDKAEESI